MCLESVYDRFLCEALGGWSSNWRMNGGKMAMAVLKRKTLVELPLEVAPSLTEPSMRNGLALGR